VETHGFDTLPILIRPEAAIAVNSGLKQPEGDYHDGLQVLVNGPLSEDRHVEIVTCQDVYSISKTISTKADGDVQVIKLNDENVKLF
jgi:alpha-D-xyloside xylohydrolase